MIEREEDQQEREQYFTEREKCQIVLDALVFVRDNPDKEPGVGICNQVSDRIIDAVCPDLSVDTEDAALDEVFGYQEDYQHGIYKSWPGYSGDFIYPVPNPSGADPNYAYYEANKLKTMWADTEYGNARRDLLNHMIKYYETELEKHNG